MLLLRMLLFPILFDALVVTGFTAIAGTTGFTVVLVLMTVVLGGTADVCGVGIIDVFYIVKYDYNETKYQ